MVAYYSITAILAFINLIIFIFTLDGKKLNYYLTFITLLIALSNGGYLALALSTNLQEAILANKICYLGGCFIPPIMLLIICAICNYHIPNHSKNIIYAYSFFVYTLVLTTGFNHLYYTDTSLGKLGNSTVLVTEYGLGHCFFYIILYGYAIIDIIILVYALIKKHSISRKNLWALVILEFTPTIIFLIGREIHSKFETMPATYIVADWILLYLHRRISMYSVEDNILSSLDNQEFYGYVMFDNRRNYLGCNHVTANILPEITTCKVDYPINNKPELNFIKKCLTDSPAAPQNISFEKNGRYYECHTERIWHFKKAVGYIIEIQDDTNRRKYLDLLSSYNSKLENQVREKTEHISSIQSKILLGMANIVENRDNNTGGHIKRTSDVIRILIDTIQENHLLPLSKEFCSDIIKAAPMHDLGKIGIDDTILKKPGRLTDEEFTIMQTHAEKSAKLVESILKGVESEHFFKVAVNVARHHHEKWNGAGYPDHLKGNEIPLEARIMAIADVYDALVSKRCYKEAMSFEKAFEVMEESMGNHFDPNLEQVFLLSREKLETYYKNAG